MGTADSGFFRGHGEKALDQGWVEAGGKRDRLREVGGVDGPVSVQALFVEDNRNFQAAVFQEKFLDFVGEVRSLTRVLAFPGIAGTSDLPDSISLLEKCFGFLRVEVAVVIQHSFRAVAPDADHLGSFFFQSHAGKEVFGPLLGREFGILVGQ